MDEKDFLELWNTKRTQVISAQMGPTLMLIGVFVLAAFGKFETASDGAKYLTIGVAAATGILAIISQYATIREAEVLLIDLKRLENSSELSKRIKPIAFKKGELVLDANNISKKSYFIKKGILRTYFIKDGKDCSLWRQD